VVPREDYIVFVSDRSGGGDIYRMKPDGTEPTNLTGDPGRDFNPIWDPTGDRIAFLSDRSGMIELYVMDVDGSGVTPVSQGDASFPSWAPDGFNLAFTSTRSGALEIWSATRDGAQVRQLTSTGGNFPDWSSDDRIVFLGPGGITVMSSDGANQVAIVSPQNPPLPTLPRWRPDATQITFHTRFEQNVYVVGDDGTALRNISNPPGIAQIEARWSPTRPELVARDLVSPGGDLWVLDANGGPSRNLTADPAATAASADWSPDGERVVFTSVEAGNSDIYVIDRDGGTATNLTNDPGADSEARWRPST
jgi:TolB protein